MMILKEITTSPLTTAFIAQANLQCLTFHGVLKRQNWATSTQAMIRHRIYTINTLNTKLRTNYGQTEECRAVEWAVDCSWQYAKTHSSSKSPHSLSSLRKEAFCPNEDSYIATLQFPLDDAHVADSRETDYVSIYNLFRISKFNKLFFLQTWQWCDLIGSPILNLIARLILCEIIPGATPVQQYVGS